MPSDLHISLPLPDPLAFLEATALFVIQLLLAQHPELLADPELPSPAFPRPVHHAHLLFTAVRELQYALEVYRACLPAHAPDASQDDDFPF